MTVFKTFLKVLNKNKFIVLMYTIILVVFAAFNFKSGDKNIIFEASKPDILIVNEDKNRGITKNLIDYLNQNCNFIDIEKETEKINDALFYRDVNYVVYIPKNFRKDFLNKKNPQISIKSTGDYQASLASMILERYMNVANIYLNTFSNEEEIIKKINDTLDKNVKVKVTSKLDRDNLNKVASYYNFANYSLLAGCIYVVCFILISFKDKNISKRIIVSSTSYKRINGILLLANGLFVFMLWLLYCLLSIFLLGKVMLTTHGIIFMLNSLIFSISTLSLAFLLANLILDKNAINGIVNIIALGSSFLCGAFVPMEFLPNYVLKIAHILPSYYYINNNELLKNIEIFNFGTLKPLLINMVIIICFIIIFIIITNLINRQKRKWS